MKRFSKVAIGGTFDHFHKGHKALLQKAIDVSRQIVVGLTSDKWVKKKPLKAQIEPFKIRKRFIENFFKKRHFKNYKIIILNDIYGPTLKDTKIEALVVSNKTLKGARKVNARRREKGLWPLPVILAKTEKTESNHCISSEYIRRGLTSRQGKVYSFIFRRTIRLTEKARLFLKKPQGLLLTRNVLEKTKKILKKAKIPFVCLVGDYTTQFFEKNNLKFDIAVIDHRIIRQKTDFLYKKKPVFAARNKRGFITPSLYRALKKAIKNKKGLVKVAGEEDLAAVALVLTLPLGSLVFYGQPYKGNVVIKIDEEIKEKFYRLLR